MVYVLDTAWRISCERVDLHKLAKTFFSVREVNKKPPFTFLLCKWCFISRTLKPSIQAFWLWHSALAALLTYVTLAILVNWQLLAPSRLLKLCYLTPPIGFITNPISSGPGGPKSISKEITGQNKNHLSVSQFPPFPRPNSPSIFVLY